MKTLKVEIGDYVIATKYSDGGYKDHWCIGFYAGLTNGEYSSPRYDIVDENGIKYRGNGFRRIKKITKERGQWILKNKKYIEQSNRSVWYYVRCAITSVE